MGAKLDILRADLRPGDGVMVEMPNNVWEWGYVSAKTNAGFMVDIWGNGPEKAYTRFCEKEIVYPDDYTWDDIAVENVATSPVESKPLGYELLPPPKPIDHVFVYGTLKKGGRLNKYLADCEFIGEDITKDKKYKMFSCGDRFPAVSDWKSSCSIAGEIYKVTPEVMKKLDDVEGVPYLYRRDKCWTLKHDIECYIYLATVKLENAYENEFGNVLYDEETKSHIWRL